MTGLYFVDYYVSNNLVPLESLFNSNNFSLPDTFRSYESMYKYLRGACGLDRISIDNGESPIDIFSHLINKFLSETRIDPREVGYIIGTPNHHFLDPDTNILSELLAKFGFNNANCFGFYQECAGGIASIGLSSALLTSKKKYNISLAYNSTTISGQRFNGSTVFGNGASIAVVSADSALSEYQVVDFLSWSDTQGTARLIQNSKQDAVSLQNVPWTSLDFLTNVLKNNNLKVEDIHALIVPTNNEFLAKKIYGQLLGAHKGVLYLGDNRNSGYLGNVCEIRNFKDYINNEIIPTGSNIVLLGIGVDIQKKGTEIQRTDFDYNYHALLLRKN